MCIEEGLRICIFSKLPRQFDSRWKTQNCTTCLPRHQIRWWCSCGCGSHSLQDIDWGWARPLAQLHSHTSVTDLVLSSLTLPLCAHLHLPGAPFPSVFLGQLLLSLKKLFRYHLTPQAGLGSCPLSSHTTLP